MTSGDGRGRIVEFTRIGLHTQVEPLTLGRMAARLAFTERIRTHATRYLADGSQEIEVVGSPDLPTGTLHTDGQRIGEFTVRPDGPTTLYPEVTLH